MVTPKPKMGSSLLEEILTELEQKSDNVDNFLKNYLTSRQIETIFQVYDKITKVTGNGLPTPVSYDAVQDATEAYDLLRCYYFLPEAEELVNLLRRPYMKALLQCHDMVANKEYAPKLPEVPYEVDEDDVSVKALRLVKKHEPLGATIKINDRNGAVLIARIMHGGAADRCAALNVGDEIQEINDHCVTGQDPMDVINLLTSITGEVRLKLCPSSHAPGFSEAGGNNYVRALFSYNPSSDKLIPCREAGLSFTRGEILRLVNTEDPHWWQAVKDGGCGRAGLIPSRLLQEKKEQLRTQSGHHSKSKEPQKANIPTYEGVMKFLPEEGNYRPIVIVGARRVGKNELKRRLISTEPEHFKEPIRITTREPNNSEVHGRDFLFVTQEEFETFVNTNSIIDGYKLNDVDRVGLCLDALLEVVQAGRVAVFTANFESIPNLYTGSIKPFIVYIKPPSLDVLKETRKVLASSQSNPELSADEKDSDTKEEKGFSEEQLEAMLNEANRGEIKFGHYFDFVVVNDDLPVALEQLSELAYRLETEPHWIPRSWQTEEKTSSL